MARFDSAQRAKILEAAIAVFAAQGLKGAATRMVGQAAGVNSALLYYYFENKQTLFVEAVRLVLRGLMDHLAEQRRDFADGRDRITFLVNGLFDYYGAHPARMRLMGVAMTLHGELLGQVVQGLVKERLLLPLAVLQEGVIRDELKPLHPVQVWWSILGMCLFSLQLRQIMDRVDIAAWPLPLPDLDQGRKEIIHLLCEGLARPGAVGSKAKHPARRNRKPRTADVLVRSGTGKTRRIGPAALREAEAAAGGDTRAPRGSSSPLKAGRGPRTSSSAAAPTGKTRRIGPAALREAEAAAGEDTRAPRGSSSPLKAGRGPRTSSSAAALARRGESVRPVFARPKPLRVGTPTLQKDRRRR